MTYKNDIEVEFDIEGVDYGATADVVVKLSKQDVGPIGYHEHFLAWIPNDIEIKNLKVGLLPTGEDFVEIPENVKTKAEKEITEKAYIYAEAKYE